MFLSSFEVVDAITEPKDFLQVGSAKAPDFDWEFPLVLSEQNQLFGTISPLIGSDEQLDAVGDFAGPWEQYQAFAIFQPRLQIKKKDERNTRRNRVYEQLTQRQTLRPGTERPAACSRSLFRWL